MSEFAISQEAITSAIESFQNAIISDMTDAIVEASDTIIGLYLHATTNRHVALNEQLRVTCHDALVALRKRGVVIMPSTDGEGTRYTYIQHD